MARIVRKAGPAIKSAASSKYDAHHKVLNTTYGSFADLRRELADSKEKVSERESVLKLFATCMDPQRAFLLLDDYLEKLSLSRKDFGQSEWWPRMQSSTGKPRLEEVAMLFLRNNRSLPTELLQYANFEKFAAVEQTEKETGFVQELENWLFPLTTRIWIHLVRPCGSFVSRSGKTRTPISGVWPSISSCSVPVPARKSALFRTCATCALVRLTRRNSSRPKTGR